MNPIRRFAARGLAIFLLSTAPTLAGAAPTPVDPVAAPTTATYTVNVVVRGLIAPGPLTVTINSLSGGGEAVNATVDGLAGSVFVIEGESYAAEVTSQPPTQHCTVINPDGSALTGETVTVDVTCGSVQIGGSVSGLAAGNQVVLRNTYTPLAVTKSNGGKGIPPSFSEDLTVAADGSFLFDHRLNPGNSYSVTVATEPSAPDQICTVMFTISKAGAAGGNAPNSSDPNLLTVTCTTPSYDINVYTFGVTSGETVDVALNGADQRSISSSASTSYTGLSGGSSYAITVAGSSPGLTCRVSDNGSGTIASANVDVFVSCGRYTLGGTLSGLASGNSLTLSDSYSYDSNVGKVPAAFTLSAIDDTTLSANGAFTLDDRLGEGYVFAVSPLTQTTTGTGPSQTCTLSEAVVKTVDGVAGTMAAANRSNLQVDCVINQFNVAGVAFGLSTNPSAEVALEFTSGSTTTTYQLNDNEAYTRALDDGSSYALSIVEPDGYLCKFDSSGSNTATGTVAGSDISENIRCAPSYRVGVEVLGVAAGNTVTLRLDYDQGSACKAGAVACKAPVSAPGFETLDVSASDNGTRKYFTQGLVPGNSYSVDIVTEDPADPQACTLTAYSFASKAVAGTIVDGDIGSLLQCVPIYQVGGSVSGLASDNTLTVLLDYQPGCITKDKACKAAGPGSESLEIAANGDYTFLTRLDNYTEFSANISVQPSTPNQSCAFAVPAKSTSQQGQINSGDFTALDIVCTTNQYTVGGSVSGLRGSGLVLQNNGGDNLGIAADGGYSFATALADGSSYDVGIATQPSNPAQTCTLALSVRKVASGPGQGTVSGANVESINIVCSTDTFSAGGLVSGLATDNTLELQLDFGAACVKHGKCAKQGEVVKDAGPGSETLVLTGNGAFSFVTALDDLTEFTASISVQPSTPNQSCDFAAPGKTTSLQGQINGSDANHLQIVCTTTQYTVGGTVSGLTGSGLVLQNNAGDDLAINGDGSFTFATALDDGSDYSVTVLQQPTSPNQTCSVAHAVSKAGTGTISGGNVSSLLVTCSTATYTIGGTASGLRGDGLILRNNDGDDLAIAADGPYTFATALADGSTYAVSIAAQPSNPNQTCALAPPAKTTALGSGTLSGANVTSIAIACTTAQYTVGGTVSGLTGNGLVLQNNAGDDLTISGDGAFTFATALDDGSNYDVTVQQQPTSPNQTCSVAHALVKAGTGTLDGSNVSSLLVTCSTTTYTIGGTVSGVLPGTAYTLTNNGGDTLTLAGSGPFTFSTALADGSNYEVAFGTAPAEHRCGLGSSTGFVSGGNVTTVDIQCEPILYVGGAVSGLASGNALVLRNTYAPAGPCKLGSKVCKADSPGSEDLTVTADGSFTFATFFTPGNTYSVEVLTQPTAPNQTCTLSRAVTKAVSGTVGSSDVNDLEVVCSTLQYSVGGTVSGLLGGGLVLQNNAGDDLAIAADGAFTFATALDDGSDYSVTVLQQPTSPNQTCSVVDAVGKAGTGSLNGSNVSSLLVACSTSTYTIGGTVSGLRGDGLVLRNNDGDDLAIAADGPYTFATALADGSTYAVSIAAQPSHPNQTCTLLPLAKTAALGSGTLSGANVASIAIACTTTQYTVGGTVSGLTGNGLVLQNNAGDDLAIAADGAFTFATALDDGSDYSITVLQQPTSPNQTCSVAHALGKAGTGSINGGNVNSLVVNCSTLQYSVGGTVGGLLGSGLVLQNNGGDNLAIAADGAFTFANALDDGSDYSVTVAAQPSNPSQTCALVAPGKVTGAGSGRIAGANVGSIHIICNTHRYRVGGTLSGLAGGKSVSLRLDYAPAGCGKRDKVCKASGSGSETLTTSVNDVFQFVTAVDDSSEYAVSVLSEPLGQTCAVNQGIGSVAGSDVTGILVACTDSATAPGAPTGVQVNASGNSVTISWMPPVDDGGSPITSYTVTLQPGGLSCTVTGNPPPTTCTINGTLPPSFTVAVAAANATGAGEPGMGSGAMPLPTPATIPTLSEWTLLLLAAIAALLAWPHLLRRRQA